jgi:hypothetical protein
MFEELGALIDQLDIPADGADLAAVMGLRDRLDARISDAVAAHDHAGLWELDGATSMTAWLADRAAMPRTRATATVTRARKLAHLPVTAAAWCDGVLSSGQVEAIAANLDPHTVALFANHETGMVPTLVDLSVRDVATAMAAWRDCATAHRHPQPEPAQALHLSRTLAGRWRLDANLGPETGELLATALRLAHSPDMDSEPARTAATRRGDALADICRHFLDHQHTHRGGRHRPHLNLVLDIDRYRALRTCRRRQRRRHPPRPHQHRPVAVRRRHPPGAQPRPLRHLGLRHRHPHHPRPPLQHPGHTRPALPVPWLRPPCGLVRRAPHPPLATRRTHPDLEPRAPVPPAPPPPPPPPLAHQAPPRRHPRGHRPPRPSPRHHPTRPQPGAPSPAEGMTPLRWTVEPNWPARLSDLLRLVRCRT